MITNKMKFHFEEKAIQRDFDIFRISRDLGNMERSRIVDVVTQLGEAIAVVCLKNECCALYRKGKVKIDSLKHLLEKYDNTICIHRTEPKELIREHGESCFAQLLCNALPILQNSCARYCNVLGKLYYRDMNWSKAQKGECVSFYALELSFSKDDCVKMKVCTFSRVDALLKASAITPKQLQSRIKYCVDNESGEIRRVLSKEKEAQDDCFVQKALYARKNVVPFLGFDTLWSYRESKTGKMHQFMRDVRENLADYFQMEPIEITEGTRIPQKKQDTLPVIRKCLAGMPIYLEDLVQNELSQCIADELAYELQQYSGVTLLQRVPQPGSVLLRIIHDRAYYADNDEKDPHCANAYGCIVQHVTLENFGKEGGIPREKENPALRKILWELAIKMDVHNRQITLYDWQKCGFQKDVSFVKPVLAEKKRLIFNKLTVHCDGSMEFDSWESAQALFDEQRMNMEEVCWTADGSFDTQVEGIVYQNPERF